MSAGAAGRPRAPATDVTTYAQELAAAAPPLTTDQLDALGRIVRSVPSTSPPKPAQARRRKARQLHLPYDQVDTKAAGVGIHGRHVLRNQQLGGIEEHPVTETG